MWEVLETGEVNYALHFAIPSVGTAIYYPTVAGRYTIEVTFKKEQYDGNGYWTDMNANDTKTSTTVIVSGPPTLADVNHNTAELSASIIKEGSSVTVTAEGDRQSATGVSHQDERYYPKKWIFETADGIEKDTGNFDHDGDQDIYSSVITPLTEGEYELKVIFQKQVYDLKGEVWLDVFGGPIKSYSLTVMPGAKPENNILSATPSSKEVTLGDSFTLTAIGDRQSEIGSFDGNERFIPVSWALSDGTSDLFSLNGGSYTSQYTPLSAGTRTVTATYKKQVWNGTDNQWEDTGVTDTKSIDLKATSATGPTQPTEADAANNSVSANPSSVTTGGTVTLTANGDRQSADGTLVGDERYVPVSWSSTESGKMGTFTKGNNGIYTSDYTPSATGSPTVTATFQMQTWDGTAWVAVAGANDTKQTTVTVTAATGPTQPTEADADNNTVSASPSSVTTGETVTLTATGDRQSAGGTLIGDERYMPVSWTSTESSGKTGTFTKGNNGKYASAYTPSTAGSHTVTATFQKQSWNGTAWVAVANATNTKTTTVTVTAATGPTEADDDNNTVSASPSSVTTGGTVTLTADGDRQSADGAFVNDERYVPVSWSSTESGKTGTFTKGNNGSYTSAYTPSIAGSHTVTATFQKQTWNGAAWVAVSGATDTKTTTVTVTAATGPTEADDDNNTVSASPSSVTTGGTVTLTADGDRQSADGAFVDDERYVPVSWSSTESSGKTGTFTKGNNGKYTSAYTPSVAGSHTVTATFQKQRWNGAAWVVVTGATDTKTIVVTVSNGSSGSGSTPLPSTSTSEGETENSVIVLVNGKAENAGTAKSTTINGQSVMTILVDQKKIEEKLAIEGFGAVVTVPVKTNSDIVVAQLNGQLIREMEDLHATLVVKTDRAIYTVPSLQINMNEVSNHIGATVPLQDIKVELQLGTTPTEMAKVVAQAATNGSFTPVMPAMDFIVKYTYGDKTVEISTFSVYVERAIAIPEGIDPNRITTGVVVDPDGTSRHVPTKITVIDGRYYAVINSLTNSTYSVVWHPLEFSDVAKHWAKAAANDMGSRMVVEGTGHDQFSPNRDITRAEFVAIMVRGLGLKPSKEAAPFLDIKEKDWYNSAISTAFAYGLIDGIGDGTFRPNDKITREQAMVIVVKAMKITGLKAKLTAQSAESLLRPFADAAASSDWAKSGIADSIQAGIIMGRSDTQLAPKAYITRAEVAAVIQRLLRKSDLI
jgi:hypothetical protein